MTLWVALAISAGVQRDNIVAGVIFKNNFMRDAQYVIALLLQAALFGYRMDIRE